MLSEKHVALAEEQADRVHTQMMAVYKPVFDTVCRVARERDMIQIPDADPFVLHYYARRMRADAYALADELYAIGDELTYTTSVNSRFSYLSVNVNGRSIAQVHKLPSYKGVHMYDLISPENGVLSLELQLHQIYVDLCNPLKAEEWKDIAEKEKQIRRRLVEKNPSGIIGGSVKRRDPFEELVIEKFASKTEVIQVNFPGDSVMQFTTMLGWREVQQIFHEISKKSGSKIRVDINAVNIPGDSQLSRCAVHYGNGNIVIYNTMGHRTIPFEVRKGRRVATDYAKAMFAMVGIWVLRMVNALGRIQSQAVRASLERKQRQLKKIDTIIPTAHRFAGIWISEQDYVRARAMENRKFVPTYYPVNQTLGAAEPFLF